MEPLERLKLIATGRSSVLPFVAALVLSSACAPIAASMRIVSEHEYRSDMSCWQNSRGQFEAFLVVAETEARGIPYFVSARCMVNSSFPNFRVSTLEMINAIQVRDPGEPIEDKINKGNLRDNIDTDLPAPGDDDDVYVFVGRLDHVKDAPSGIYVIEEVRLARKLDMPFRSLVETDPMERFNLFRSRLQGDDFE